MNIQNIISDFQSVASIKAYDEVNLFRLLAESIVANSSKSIFINETHGTKAKVEFKSQIFDITRCEISDLLIVSRNTKTNQYRATFLQAKKETSTISSLHNEIRNFIFKGQYNQWELLSHRPNIITGFGKFNPHPELLSKAASPSIGSFGVFYEEKAKVEFNYSVAEFVSVAAKSKQPKMVINEMLTKHKIHIPFSSAPREVIVQKNLKTFLHALSTFRVGSLILPKRMSHKWLISYIYSKCHEEEIKDFFDDNIIDSIDKLDGTKGDGLSLLLMTTNDDFINRAYSMTL